MCGIVGAVSENNITGILIEGLKCLEYRGYDSAGLAVIDKGSIRRERKAGKVCLLEEATTAAGLCGTTGIAHTRWATHGAPTQDNAHPHMSDDVAVVHNGIIENYETLRVALQADGFVFESQTDSEVVAHLIRSELRTESDFLQAVRNAVNKLQGAFSLGIVRASEADRLIAVRKGSPLVIGLGESQNFIGSDQLALRALTNRFIYMDEGDIADVYRAHVRIYDCNNNLVKREVINQADNRSGSSKGAYRHYMLKEIYEQPQALQRTIDGRIWNGALADEAFGARAARLFKQARHVQIIACGTSFHAGMICRYWMEQLAGISCTVEVASEFRYRRSILPPSTLVIAISQSGETADTLAALRESKRKGILASLGICNVATSTMMRETDLSFLTHAGPEIGVASTKAFTTQLLALMLVVLGIGRERGFVNRAREATICKQLQNLPTILNGVLAMDRDIRRIAEDFSSKQHALFLGRGTLYPVAMEGALKLKETSYIHAEAYPAGELKHGPLALVDRDMPVIAVAPNNSLIDKLKSNIQEVRARAGVLYVFADRALELKAEPGIKVITMPAVPEEIAPIVYTVPLQLLAYHVAVIRNTDVDQPRNLAKSVTVE
jgi:glucosamine--fructose-6-phosphate aminotransferase (isomerizing)